jgi:hypothetical protein
MFVARNEVNAVPALDMVVYIVHNLTLRLSLFTQGSCNSSRSHIGRQCLCKSKESGQAYPSLMEEDLNANAARGLE